MFLNEFYNTKIKEESKNDQEEDDQLGLVGSGAMAGGAAGALAALGDKLPGQIKSSTPVANLAKGAAKGLLPGVGLGMSAAEAAKYLKQKNYGQAAIAAGSGLAGLMTGPVGATVLPAVGAITNACLDEPEACEELAQYVKDSIRKPFQSTPDVKTPSQRGRGAGRNVLPSVRESTVGENIVSNTQMQPLAADSKLIQSIKDVESGNNPAAVSPKGALGTMQVMPGTARNPGFGVEPAKDFSPQELERVGQDYFNAMLNRYGGDKRLALIAYNMGPGAADKWVSRGGRIGDLPRETQGYVPKVLGRYQQSPQTNAADQIQPTQIQPTQRATKLLKSMPSFSNQADVTPPRTRSKGASTAWTPPPGPKMGSYNQPDSLEPIIRQKNIPDSLEPIIRQKNRPDSIEQIIKTKNVKKADLDRLLQLFRDNPAVFSSMDNDTLNLVQSINDLYKDSIAESNQTLKENIVRLPDLIYTELEMTYGDLVKLYGHEVVGDAIEEVLLQQDDETEDIPVMAKKVLRILRQRFDQTENKEPENEIDKKDTTGVEDKNAMIQLQADVDKIKNTLGVKESKIYFNVLATSDQDCREKFKLRKDRQGWYLRESATPKIKLDAIRAFQIL
jgi:hypothetical protein